MSIGNLKTDGGKGTNWPWQYKMLKGLQGIIDVINSTAGGKEYEAELVSIICAAPIAPIVTPAGTYLRLEVRTWNTVTGGFTDVSYYKPGDPNPDPNDYSDCTITYLEAGDATEVTLAAILAMNTLIEGDTTAIATSTDNTDTNTAGILADTAVIETNTTGILADTAVIETNTTGILADTAVIETNTTGILADTTAINLNTAPFIGVIAALRRETTPGSVGLLVKSVSIANVGTEDGLVLGTVLSAGETITFDAGSLNNTLAGIAYDPTSDGVGVTATTFLIATLT